MNKVFAKNLDVSERTLREWKRNYLLEMENKTGRPKRGLTMRLKLVKLVRTEWEEQGRPGWRPISEKLKGHPVDLIQKYVALLKKKERASHWQYKREEAIKTEVLFEGVVWTQDATFLKENEKRTYAEMIKDRCTLKIIEAKKVDSMNTENVMEILKEKEMPLVYMTDNGSAYCSREVETFLAKKKVIHLKNLPATPQHNGGSEVAIRELKRQVTVLQGRSLSLDQVLVQAKKSLNTKRLWRKHGYITAYEKALNAQLHNKEELRVKIYSEYQKGLVAINKTLLAKNKKRMRERELIFGLLEKYKLIKRYRGSREYAA